MNDEDEKSNESIAPGEPKELVEEEEDDEEEDFTDWVDMMSDSMHVCVVGRIVEEQSDGDTCMRMHLIMKRASPIVTASMSVRKQGFERVETCRKWAVSLKTNEMQPSEQTIDKNWVRKTEDKWQVSKSERKCDGMKGIGMKWIELNGGIECVVDQVIRGGNMLLRCSI